MLYPSRNRLIGRARERIWLGIEKEIPAEVLVPHRSLILRVVNEVRAAFAELMDTEDMSEGTWKRAQRPR